MAGKDEKMKNERIVSMQANTMIYHKPGCRYIKRIQYKNKLSLSKKDAKKEGYHICRYCNSMDHHMRTEDLVIDYYNRIKNMQFQYMNGILYVKTEIGIWKLVYIRKEEKIALYHGNRTGDRIQFEHPEREPYHRQDDKMFSNTISEHLRYIYEHDKYKVAVNNGETVTRFSSKKYERLEPYAKRKRARKRVDQLFNMLEKQNAGYKQLSFC